MTAKAILNPYSNRWTSKARWPEVEAALKAAGMDFEMVISERKGHIVELAEQAARSGFTPILAVGGDGTVSEVANGLARAAGSEQEILGPLGIMPTGTANDICFSLGLPTDLAQAAKIIAEGKTKNMDLGQLNGKYFVNNSAAGLEPYVSIKHEAIHWIKGMARYIVAAVQGVLDKPEWSGVVKWDDGEYEGPLSLLSIGNGRRTGGFFMTPHADMFDGKLALAFGYVGTRLGLFQALPRALNEGEKSYIYIDGIREVQTTKISFHLDRPSPAHTDGELFPEWIQDFEYSIQPGRLTVLVP
jgi:diacylglycerol kinase (ATP)